jgi:hypothetical protein
LELNIFAPSFGGHVYYQRYKGFYIDEPRKAIPNWTEGMGHPQRPDIRTFNAGAEFYYIFNYKRFSQRASFVNNERQKRSAGSWLAGSYFIIFNAKADSSFLPRNLHNVLEDHQSTDRVSLMNAGISGGYIHTFVLKKYWYFTISAELGLGVQNVNNKSAQNELSNSNKWGAGNKFKSRMALGYNGIRYFAGMNMTMDNVRVTTKRDAWLENSLTQFRIFFGHRLVFNHRKTFNKFLKKKKG